MPQVVAGMSHKYSDLSRHTHTIDHLARKLVMTCTPEAYGKCADCGATIRGYLDWQLHSHASRASVLADPLPYRTE